VIEPGSTLTERDDVVDLCRYTLALMATHLALVVVPLQDLRSDSLPGVIVGCARLWWGAEGLPFSPTHRLHLTRGADCTHHQTWKH
jgi:hypothetical protein